MIVTDNDLAQFKNKVAQRIVTLGKEQAEEEFFNGVDNNTERKAKLFLLYTALLFVGNPNSGYTNEQTEDIISYVEHKCELHSLGHVDFDTLEHVTFLENVTWVGGGGGGISLPILASQVNGTFYGETRNLQVVITDIYSKIDAMKITSVDGGTPYTNF